VENLVGSMFWEGDLLGSRQAEHQIENYAGRGRVLWNLKNLQGGEIAESGMGARDYWFVRVGGKIKNAR